MVMKLEVRCFFLLFLVQKNSHWGDQKLSKTSHEGRPLGIWIARLLELGCRATQWELGQLALCSNNFVLKIMFTFRVKEGPTRDQCLDHPTISGRCRNVLQIPRDTCYACEATWTARSSVGICRCTSTSGVTVVDIVDGVTPGAVMKLSSRGASTTAHSHDLP